MNRAIALKEEVSMYILNGIVYVDKKTERIKVQSARVLDNRMILVTFEGGEMKR